MSDNYIRLASLNEHEIKMGLNSVRNKANIHLISIFHCRILKTRHLFTDFYNLTILHLRNCGIRNLHGSVFEHLVNLNYVNLEVNCIKIISNDLFNNNKQLNTIILKYNLLRFINLIAFSKVKGLTVLDLSHNHISGLFSFCIRSFTLRSFLLSFNKISLIALTAFYVVPNLLNLELQFNRISHLKNEHFLHIPALRHLNLSNNTLKEIQPLVFNPMTRLEVLLLGNTYLSKITNHMFYYNGYLTVLDLSKNDIFIVDRDTFSNLPNLQHLYISVMFRFVFQSIQSLRHLVTFELYFKGLRVLLLDKELANIFQNKPNLRFLKLIVYNFGVSQDMEFAEFPNLNYLQVECIRPSGIAGNIDITRVFNKVAGLQTLALKRLNHFTISSTADNDPTDSYFNLFHLRHLDLSGMKNTQITDQFSLFTSLEYLDLSFSEITSISDIAFSTLVNLRQIHLQQSKFEFITAKLFERNLNLVVINVAKCCLKVIENYSFKNLRHLKILDLKENYSLKFSNKIFFGLTNATTVYI